ncbi:hypothetical protein [Kitasatospora fiedleri]|uniref:hypothetical protein n=1 Tax=Kitasatospora fiedleri TaxID=2991545 RepID=UPI00249AB35A|nr:hypothetical protein [Kitasatospora fiedleri]
MGLPPEDLLIAGSAPLYVRGLRDRIGDLDVVARGEALRRALLLGEPEPAPFDGAVSVRLLGGRLEITDSWFTGLLGGVEELFDRAEEIGGLRFLGLADTAVWKRWLDRPKDRLDLHGLDLHGLDLHRPDLHGPDLRGPDPHRPTGPAGPTDPGPRRSGRFHRPRPGCSAPGADEDRDERGGRDTGSGPGPDQWGASVVVRTGP